MITEEDLRTYREQGYITFDRFISEEDRVKIMGLFDREFGTRTAMAVDVAHIDPHIIHGTDPAKIFEMIKASGKFLEDYVEGRCAMRHLSYFNPAIDLPEIFTPELRDNLVEAGTKLLDITEEELKVFACLLWKPAGGGATTWHQEDSFDEADQMQCTVGCWIALEDADEANGCMTLVPGTHVGPLRPHPALGRATVDPEEIARGISVPLKAGGVLLFNGRLLHGSNPNDSDRERRVLTISLRSPRLRSIDDHIPDRMSEKPRGGRVPVVQTA